MATVLAATLMTLGLPPNESMEVTELAEIFLEDTGDGVTEGKKM
jgi:hypothetical protein